MSEPTAHPDAADPIDGLRRVVEAISSGQAELEPADLYAVSRLSTAAEDVVRERLAALDSVGRFALLERLREVGGEFGGYDFTMLFRALAADADVSVRTLVVGGWDGARRPRRRRRSWRRRNRRRKTWRCAAKQ